MERFAGLDESVNETSVRIVDDTGKIVREEKVTQTGRLEKRTFAVHSPMSALCQKRTLTWCRFNTATLISTVGHRDTVRYRDLFKAVDSVSALYRICGL
jgi:hypothetical protein